MDIDNLDNLISNVEFVVSVSSDGSNFHGKIYYRYPKTDFCYDNFCDKSVDYSSKKCLTALNPGNKIIPRLYTEDELTAKSIFKDVYKLFPYGVYKKYIKDKHLSESEFNFFKFYEYWCRSECLLRGVRFEDIFTPKFLLTLIEQELSNAKARVNRFKRKAFNNHFDYFITITYSDEKFTNEDEFKQSLEKLFYNLKDRYDISVLGAWERGTSGTERLHFHGFMQLNGKLPPDWKFTFANNFNFKHHNIRKYLSCDYFTERFGLNEFCELSDVDPSSTEFNNMLNYCMKYISKDKDNFYIGRHLPDVYYFTAPSNFTLEDIISLYMWCKSLFFNGIYYFNDGIVDSLDLYTLSS